MTPPEACELYYPRLRRFARSRAQSPDMAEDATHDAIVAVLGARNLRQVVTYSYLCQQVLWCLADLIANKRSGDADYRARRDTRTVHLDDPELVTEPASTPPLDEDALRELDRLPRLPAQARRALWLRYGEGWTWPQIVTETGIGRDHWAVRQSRGIRSRLLKQGREARQRLVNNNGG